MNIKTAVHNRLMKIQGLLRQIYHKYRVVKRMKRASTSVNQDHCSRRYGFLQTQSVVLVHTVYIPIANLNFANFLHIAVPG